MKNLVSGLGVLFVLTCFLFVFSYTFGANLAPETDVTNLSPVFIVTPSDGGSSAESPTNPGSNITFTATAEDVNLNQYYLAVCKTDAVTVGNNAAPTCDGGAWAISEAVNSGSQALAQYEVTGSEICGEVCEWYIFVCDKVSGGGSCYPANGLGDQGLAEASISFSGVPADGATLTIDSVIYEFDTAGDGISGGIEVDTSVSEFGTDAAAALVAVEAGTGSHMIQRTNKVYVYADSAGDVSISLAEAGDTGSAIALSDVTLQGGSNANASPFAVNYAPSFGTVTVTDTNDDVINPGDSLRFTLPNAEISDDNAIDTIDMYICDSAGFTYGASPSCTGTLICSDIGVDPASEDATCDETGNVLVPVSDARGSEDFYIYLQDNHFLSGVGTNLQSYNIVNTAPTHGTPEIDVHAPIIPNSVGYWQFEDGYGVSSFDDETIYDNEGSCTSCPDWIAEGYSGGAYDFNGTDDYMSMGNDSILNPANEISVAAWVNPESLGETSPYARFIITKRDSSNTSYYLGYFTDLDRILFAVSADGSERSPAIYSLNQATFENGGWYYVVGTFRDNETKLYVNGSLIDTTVHTGSDLLLDSTTVSVTIGSMGDATRFWNGQIDEPHIYNRALTADEISAIYNAYTIPGTSDYTDSNMDLSCKALTVSDHDSDSTTTIFNWLKDGSSITVLNMPFDSNISSNESEAILDYSGAVNHGTLRGGVVETADTGSGAAKCVETSSYLLNYTDDYYNGWTFEPTSGAASGQTTTVSDYIVYDVENNKEIIFTSSLTGFTSGDTYKLYYSDDDGPTWTSSGINGGAYDFDGVDDHIVLGSDKPDLTEIAGDKLTIEAWIKPDSVSGSHFIAVKNGPFIFSLNNNKIRGGITTLASGWTYNIGEIAITADEWHYVVMVYDGSNINLYVDGIFDTAEPKSGDLNGDGFAYIGSSCNGMENGNPSSYFDGLIDEVRIYNSALSAEQITQNYNNGKPSYNTIVNQEIAEGDSGWQCKVTLNDAQTYTPDSAVNSSNTIDPSNSEPVQGIPSARAHALTDTNSVGYWRFEDGDITSNILDETSNNNDGSCTNCPDWTPEGAIGGGYEFDGENDYITIPSSSSLSFSGSDAFTVSTWVKINGDGATGGAMYDQIVGKWGGYNLMYQPSATNPRVRFLVYTSDESPIYIDDYALISLGEWHHVAGIFDGSNIEIFLDGVGSGSPASFAGETLKGTATALNIGSYSADFNRALNGSIDEPHIYNRALSASEIADLYNSASYVYADHDLGVSARDKSDADGDDLYATADWRESDASIAVLNMSFNESVTSTEADAVLDYSSYGNHGQLGGGTADYVPTWTNATTCGNDSGGCYDFDGGDSLVVNDSSSLELPDTYSFELWINPDSVTSTVYPILVKGSAPNRYMIWLKNDEIGGVGHFHQGGCSGSCAWTDYTYSTDANLSAGQWAHIVFTFDYSASTQARLYKDGSEVTLVNYSGIGQTPDTGSYDLLVGMDNSENFHFAGLMDEFRLYDRVLSEEQIIANYNAGKPNYQYLVSEETSVGDIWSSFITITEGNSESSVTLESNDVEILGFLTDVSDGGSSADMPTDADDDVTFTATGNTAGDQYYLAICKTDGITPGNDSAPTCDGGDWAISTATDDSSQASAVYNSDSSDSESNEWYGFICTKVSGGGSCSSSSQGTGDNGSPFIVNHAPLYQTYIVDDNGVDTTIEPGDTIKFAIGASGLVETDITGVQDTVDIVICDSNTTAVVWGDGSNPACTGGSRICFADDHDPTTAFSCTNAAWVLIPTAHGSYDFKPFIIDNHGLEGTADSGHNTTQSYDVADVSPQFIEYDPSSSMTAPAVPAGGSNSFTFDVRLKDNNGVGTGINDITAVSGVYFLELETKDCLADTQNCYPITSCSVNSVVASGSCSGYSDTCIDYTCTVDDVYYNSNSGDWEVHVAFADETGSVTDTQISSDDNIDITELLAIDINSSTTSIDYGIISIGSTSSEQEVSVGNAGNQLSDFTINGISMCSDYHVITNPECANSAFEDKIPIGQQKWNDSSSFNWQSGYGLVETANSACTLGSDCSEQDGCANYDIAVRSDGSVIDSIENNESLYWKLQIPEDQLSGSYQGYIRFAPISNSSCINE